MLHNQVNSCQDDFRFHLTLKWEHGHWIVYYWGKARLFQLCSQLSSRFNNGVRYER